MGSRRGWLAGDWPSTGGVLNITAAVWTAGFRWWRFGNKKRTQNVSEYMLVLMYSLYAWLLLLAWSVGQSVTVVNIDLESAIAHQIWLKKFLLHFRHGSVLK